jgi:pectinesterase
VLVLYVNFVKLNRNDLICHPMPRLTFLLLLTLSPTLFFRASGQGQPAPWPGLTHQRDTSYNTASAFISVKKSFPDAQLVNNQLIAGVAIQPNIEYGRVGSRSLRADVFFKSATNKHSAKRGLAQNRPAIVLIHGGGWRTGNRQQHHAMAQRLAATGYVVVTPEYRLSTEALYPAAVHDLKTAIRWLRSHASQYNIDTNQIAAVGFSAGGQLAALLGSTGNLSKLEGNGGWPGHSSAVQAVVDIDGILAFIHPESGEGDDSKRVSAATNWFGGSKTDVPERWKEASALTYAGKQTAPTLFLNSAEPRMHAGRDDFLEKVKPFGIYTEVHEFAGAPHSFCLFQPWFEPTVARIEQFLGKVLGNK